MALSVACGGGSGSGTRNPAGDGSIDAPAGGGERGTDGTGGTAGQPGTGGVGGQTSGQSGTGGMQGTGGKIGTGGSAGTGGTAGYGGIAGTGGIAASGGNASTGGKVGTGGLAGTGGAVGTGGLVGTGGKIGTGGLVSTGGKIGSGGVSGTGGRVGTGGMVGTGGVSGGTGGADPNTPILDRPPRATYACSIAEPVAELPLGGDRWSTTSTPLLVFADKYWAGRWQFPGSTLDLQLSSIGFDGTLGAVTSLTNKAYGSQNAELAVAERGGSFAMVWVDGAIGGAQSLRFAQVLPSGTLQTTPTNIAGTEGTWLNLPRLLPTTSGFVLAWVEGTASAHRLHVAQLSATGALVGNPAMLWDAGTRLTSAAFVAVGDGYALAVLNADAASNTWVEYFALEASGAQRGTALRMSGFTSLPILLTQSDRLLLGWSDGTDRGVVHLGRFDAAGQALGTAVALQAPPAAGRQNRTPSLVDVDGDVAIAWSEGHAQQSVTDYEDVHMNFVIVDGDDFVPLSQLVEVTSPKSGTGVYNRVAVRIGLDFLVVGDIASHLYDQTASVGIRCTK